MKKIICLIFAVLTVTANVSAYETAPEVLIQYHREFASVYAFRQNSFNKSVSWYDVPYISGIDYRGDGFQYEQPPVYIDYHAKLVNDYDMSVSDNLLYINGKENEYSGTHYMYNSRTLVPVKAFETMGCEVQFDESTYVCTISANNTVLEILPGLKAMRKNKETGYWVPLEVCARFTDDVLYIPVRAVADQFGFYVRWDGETGNVFVDSIKTGYEDTRPPLLFINETPEKAECSEFELCGSVWDKDSKAEVFINGEKIVSAEINEDKDWNKKFILSEGENIFNITVKNESGYEASEIKTVNYIPYESEENTTAPEFIYLKCPKKVDFNTVVIEGGIKNLGHGVKMSINGHNTELTGEYYNVFTITLKGLKEGDNVFKFVLSNNHGKTTEVTKTITYKKGD